MSSKTLKQYCLDLLFIFMFFLQISTVLNLCKSPSLQPRSGYCKPQKLASDRFSWSWVATRDEERGATCISLHHCSGGGGGGHWRWWEVSHCVLHTSVMILPLMMILLRSTSPHHHQYPLKKSRTRSNSHKKCYYYGFTKSKSSRQFWSRSASRPLISAAAGGLSGNCRFTPQLFVAMF